MTSEIQKLVGELRAKDHRQPIDPKAVYRTRDVALYEEVADLITRLAGALERTQRVMVQLVEPDMSVPPASIYFEARAAELVARQALTGTPIKA